MSKAMAKRAEEGEAKGIVEGIEQKKTRKGEEYWIVTIDGERYSLWNKDYFEQLQEGDLVAYRWRESGDFKKIVEIERIGNDLEEREKKLTKMGCLKYAVELAASAFNLDETKKLSFALEAAEAFERYIMGLEGRPKTHRENEK
ncbi:MAG: hypothetical protein QXS01_05045 [Candidatus Bathyarchaeia archaeon]